MTLVSAASADALVLPAPRPVPFPDVPFTRFRLSNGLTLIVHEDHSSPLIAAEIRYNVGSKNEPAGRFGFAHLFEHLMFRESANRRGNWHMKLAELGGSNVNGTTSYDRTNYYQTVPSGAIDTLLWMESDRMGHLLDGLSREALAAEVEIVKNEKRERESAPLGTLAELIAETLYPLGHPYGHTVIGTFADLDRATLETAHDWYRRWYGAGNAIVVLVGDITPEAALAKVEHWFGDIPKGPPLRRATEWLPPRQGAQRLMVEERVANPGLVRVWTVPCYGTQDTVDLGLLAAALTGAPSAILTRQLVDEERLCIAVEASVERRYLCSEFGISATFATGADGARVAAIIDEALALLLADGPSEDEIDRICRSGRLAFVGSIESLAIRAELLASSEMDFGMPDGYRRLDALCGTATPPRIAAAGRRWLASDSLTIDVHPLVESVVTVPAPDRTVAPAPYPVVAPRFPAIERARLRNGIEVQVAQRPGTASVATVLLVEGGTAGDPYGQEGLTACTLALQQAGTVRHDRRALVEWQRRINASIVSDAAIDSVSVRCNSLPGNYAEAIDLMAQVALHPAFAPTELDHAQAKALQALDAERLSRGGALARASAIHTFGTDHMLARRAQGTAATISGFTTAHLHDRHTALFQASAATVFVVGDVALADVFDTLDEEFGNWTNAEQLSRGQSGSLDPAPGRYLLARRDVDQSIIDVAVARPEFGRTRMTGPAMGVFSHILGGSFGSRLNRNLRERRGWTYGINSGFDRWRDVGRFGIRTSVQADHTIEALHEIEQEIAGIATIRPVTAEELERARAALLLEMPSYWTSHDSVLAGMIDAHRHQLPSNHYDRIEERLRSLSLTDVLDIAALVAPVECLTVTVSGDPARFDTAKLLRLDEAGLW